MTCHGITEVFVEDVSQNITLVNIKGLDYHTLYTLAATCKLTIK